MQQPISMQPFYEESFKRSFHTGRNRVVLSGQSNFARIGEVGRVGDVFTYPDQKDYANMDVTSHDADDHSDVGDYDHDDGHDDDNYECDSHVDGADSD